MASSTIFKNIRSCMTLKNASKKQGRNITDKDLSFVSKSAFVVQAGKIVWLGSEKKLPSKFKSGAKIVDLGGRFVYPGFVECHTHSVFGGDRSEEFEMRNQGVSYQEIAKRGGGILSTVKMTRKASSEDLFERLRQRAQLFVAQGVTTLEIKSGYGLRRNDEIKMLEVANRLKTPRIVTTYLGPHAIPKGSTPEKYMASVAKDLEIVRKKQLADRCDIFIEKGYFDLDLARDYFSKAKELGFEITVHADQLSRTGATRLAIEYGAQSADHVIELSTADISRLAQSSVTGVLLPAADFYLDCPYPKARDLIDQGGRVALATDFNPGSSPTQDLALVGLLARKKMKMTLSEVWAAYTLNSAYALGLQDQVGTLEVGKFADFIVSSKPWTAFFYEAGYMPVEECYFKSRRVYKTKV